MLPSRLARAAGVHPGASPHARRPPGTNHVGRVGRARDTAPTSTTTPWRLLGAFYRRAPSSWSTPVAHRSSSCCRRCSTSRAWPSSSFRGQGRPRRLWKMWPPLHVSHTACPRRRGRGGASPRRLLRLVLYHACGTVFATLYRMSPATLQGFFDKLGKGATGQSRRGAQRHVRLTTGLRIKKRTAPAPRGRVIHHLARSVRVVGGHLFGRATQRTAARRSEFGQASARRCQWGGRIRVCQRGCRRGQQGRRRRRRRR